MAWSKALTSSKIARRGQKLGHVQKLLHSDALWCTARLVS